MMFKLVNNQKGSMLVNAIATSIIIAIISGVILQQSLTALKTLRAPRVKSSMTAVEGSLRFLLLQAENYSLCDADVTGIASCVFTPNIADLKEQIPGCDNGTSSPVDCGVIVSSYDPPGPEVGLWNPLTRMFHAEISYQGTELPIKSKIVAIEVPIEILTQSNVNCPPAGFPDRILFKGFTPAGIKICEELPGNTAGCPAGQFMSGFNPSTMAIVCQALTNSNLDCGALGGPQMVESVTFTGTGFSRTCKTRQTPTSIWTVPP